MSAQHTPWKITDNADSYNGAKPVAIENNIGEIVACNTTYYPTAINADDAAHIVACVNAMPELLEAAQIGAIWLTAALSCTLWIWDGDQREAAEFELAKMKTAIAKVQP